MHCIIIKVQRGLQSPLFLYNVLIIRIFGVMDFENKIKEMVEKKSNHESIFLIDVVVKNRNEVNNVTVILDGDNGVTISD